MKGFFVRYRIDKYDSCGSFIICLGDGFEPFLSSSIPDLHFNFDAINVNGFNFKIYPDSSDMGHLILFVDVSE